MNILVTGGNGQLGTELRNVSADSRHHWIFSDVNSLPDVETLPLDITNASAVKIVCKAENIGLVVNCAAYTNVDKAESDVGFADLLNHQAAGNLATAAKETGAGLIHISTDYVFGGVHTKPIPENDRPSPDSVYGATKYAGEVSIQRTGCRHIIIRTAWLYSPYGKNFLRTMLRLTAEKPEIRVVNDQIGTPTYALDLAKLIVHIIDTGQLDKTGIYHYSNEGVISWYDFACAINELSGHSCKVLPISTAEYPTAAVRPSYSVLDKSLVKATFGISIPDWTDSLKDCMARL